MLTRLQHKSSRQMYDLEYYYYIPSSNLQSGLKISLYQWSSTWLFWPIFCYYHSACSLTTVQLSKGSNPSVLMLSFCPCLSFVPVATIHGSKIESHKLFKWIAWKKIATNGEKVSLTSACEKVTTDGCVAYKPCWCCSNLRMLNWCLFEAATSILVHTEIHKAMNLTIT